MFYNEAPMHADDGWLSCQGVVDAQLDAYVGGSGEWATGADDDDDDYEDECVAET